MGLASTFTNSFVREIGRNYGKSISNHLLGDSHSTPVPWLEDPRALLVSEEENMRMS